MSYTGKIKEIGPMVASFEEEMLLVLFGPNAPEALREISVIHEEVESNENLKIEEGSKLQIGDYEYNVLAVGSEAVANFKELGHISIYFQTNREDLLPGTIQVEPEVYPKVEEGQTIRFYE